MDVTNGDIVLDLIPHFNRICMKRWIVSKFSTLQLPFGSAHYDIGHYEHRLLLYSITNWMSWCYMSTMASSACPSEFRRPIRTWYATLFQIQHIVSYFNVWYKWTYCTVSSGVIEVIPWHGAVLSCFSTEECIISRLVKTTRICNSEIFTILIST